jgi:hypothetical protein
MELILKKVGLPATRVRAAGTSAKFKFWLAAYLEKNAMISSTGRERLLMKHRLYFMAAAFAVIAGASASELDDAKSAVSSAGEKYRSCLTSDAVLSKANGLSKEEFYNRSFAVCLDEANAVRSAVNVFSKARSTPSNPKTEDYVLTVTRMKVLWDQYGKPKL